MATENGSESLPFEPPERENIRLREENARLRRLLAVHGIPIPQLAPANPLPTKTVETASPVDKEERARKRIAARTSGSTTMRSDIAMTTFHRGRALFGASSARGLRGLV
jgi:hypothetical protein